MKNTTVNGINKKIIITPKVVENAKKHFGCDSLIGVELEDQGGEGTSGSHWESRILFGDYMIGESNLENVISEITLGLFEDSGWYKTNYYTGGLFRFGKNLGCDFLYKKCIIEEKSIFTNQFCIKPMSQMCTPSRLGKGFCSLDSLTNIPSQYQYFSDKKLGGYTLADYCPLAISQDVTSNIVDENHCGTGLSNLPKLLGEKISENSNCFISSLLPRNISSLNDYYGKSFTICYEILCNERNYFIKITDGNKTQLECPREGGIVTSPSYEGVVNCPDYNLICTKNGWDCKDLIECAMKNVTRKDYVYDYKQNNGQDLGNVMNFSLIEISLEDGIIPTSVGNFGQFISYIGYCFMIYLFIIFN